MEENAGIITKIDLDIWVIKKTTLTLLENYACYYSKWIALSEYWIPFYKH